MPGMIQICNNCTNWVTWDHPLKALYGTCSRTEAQTQSKYVCKNWGTPQEDREPDFFEDALREHVIASAALKEPDKEAVDLALKEFKEARDLLKADGVSGASNDIVYQFKPDGTLEPLITNPNLHRMLIELTDRIRRLEEWLT